MMSYQYWCQKTLNLQLRNVAELLVEGLSCGDRRRTHGNSSWRKGGSSCSYSKQSGEPAGSAAPRMRHRRRSRRSRRPFYRSCEGLNCALCVEAGTGLTIVDRHLHHNPIHASVIRELPDARGTRPLTSTGFPLTCNPTWPRICGALAPRSCADRVWPEEGARALRLVSSSGPISATRPEDLFTFKAKLYVIVKEGCLNVWTEISIKVWLTGKSFHFLKSIFDKPQKIKIKVCKYLDKMLTLSESGLIQ